MKELKLIMAAVCLLMIEANAQTCCNVVDSDGKQVITKNGVCVKAPNLLGDGEDCIPKPIDTDGDGVADDLDKCPNEAGSVANNGCPVVDSDNDGVADVDDKCPNLAGLATNDGCPSDKDGDGVYDTEDNCPNLAGLVSNKGCPQIKDSDGDGIADADDHCPNEVGVRANHGCPELTQEESQSIAQAIEGVNFLSGKDVLTEDSKPKLDNVAKVLLAHNSYKIKVSGYTDSSGSDALNLALSKKRAQAVKEYLIHDGVAANRIEAEGYGEANPIADNSTAAGRAKNRRVEFEIVF